MSRIYGFNGFYGYTTIYHFQDADGNFFKWFTQSDLYAYGEGDKVLVKATIKDHEDHPDYGKSTILTRVKLIRNYTEESEVSE